MHVLVCRENDEVLFLQRANTGYADGQWSVPAGHVEFGENATTAAVRECIEEIGVKVDRSDLSLVLVQHKRDPIDGDERVDLFFRTARFAGEPQNCEPQKCAQLKWSRPGKMAGLIGYVQHAIDSIEDGEIYAEYGW